MWGHRQRLWLALQLESAQRRPVHTVSALATGWSFGRATVTVTTFGEEFPKNLGKHARLEDFPDPGTDLIVAWQQSLQNFTIARLDNFGPRIASIDAIGDSISKAVNAGGAGECTNEDQESFNWATSITRRTVRFAATAETGSIARRNGSNVGRDTMIVNADPNSAESGAEMLKDFVDARRGISRGISRDATSSTLCHGRNGP